MIHCICILSRTCVFLFVFLFSFFGLNQKAVCLGTVENEQIFPRRITCTRSESARECRIALNKSDQQHTGLMWLHVVVLSILIHQK